MVRPIFQKISLGLVKYPLKMALSQSLQQKLLQKLSPQQIQLMKLLQVPTANLEERIKEELEENPALEVAEEDRDDGLTDESKDEFERSTRP